MPLSNPYVPAETIPPLGVLNKVARGHNVVVKPPMIARYHMWRRNLVA
jgi:hypothetical protein